MYLWLAIVVGLLPMTPLLAQTPVPAPAATVSIEPDASDPSLANAPFDEELLTAQIEALLEAKLDMLMADMSVEDKVGQLFVVDFAGNATDFESDIAVLIHSYHVGGVVISPGYGNFSNEKSVDTPRVVAGLTNRLQALAYGLLLPQEEELLSAGDMAATLDELPVLADVTDETGLQPIKLPLLIAVEQLGDNLEATSLRRNFTELPSQMALGATWNTGLSRQVGAIVGQQLEAVGVNVLLGPNLDILTEIRTDRVGQLGVQMYGGNPFWAGELGKAYIQGVHLGSDSKVLTVARHFPGQGDVDRMPDREVATIQTSLEEMQATALVPFNAVTSHAPTSGPSTAVDPSSAVTDMLMPSNMRYSAFQGAGPERIPPLSLSPDLPAALESQFTGAWDDSGLLMSNALGIPAIRRFYDPTLAEFPARTVALDAFTAGNDLLYLGQFASEAQWDAERVNIESTVIFFQDQYRTDPDFAVRVDQAVRRILQAKLRLYLDPAILRTQAIDLLTRANLTANTVLTEPVDTLALPALIDDELRAAPVIPLIDLMNTEEGLAVFAPDNEARVAANAIVRQVARESITVLYPDISVTAPTEALPSSPGSGDNILIFTDVRLVRECATCTAEVGIGPDDLGNIILRLYGPDGTGQMTAEQITNRTFADLVELLETEARAADPGVQMTPAPAGPLITPEAALPDITTPLEEPVPTDEVVAEPLDKQQLLQQEIQEADWIIFNMLNVDTTAEPASDAVKRFLNVRGPQTDGKRLVVLSLQAPYYLDATEISSLSMYLGVYAKSQPFLENAVRALFRSYVPQGAPSVDVPGTRFADLTQRLQAGAGQTLPVQIFLGEQPLLDPETGTQVASGAAPLQTGDVIRMQVGPILDSNGHLVPDGTRVEFQLTYERAELGLNVQPADTRDGVATREVVLERDGTLQILATSGDSATSEPIILTVAQSQAAAVATQVAIGALVEPAPVATAPPAGEILPVGENAPVTAPATPNVALLRDRVNLATLLVALFIILITMSILLIVQVRILPRAMLVHNLLWAVIAGLAAYIIYGVGLLPGANWLYGQLDVWAAGLVVFLGMIFQMLFLQLRSLRD